MSLARFVAFHEIPEDATGALPALSYAVMMARAPAGVLLVFSRFRQVWELPGGRIDAGETPRDAAVRELLEESGCVARAVRWGGVVQVDDGHAHFGALFHCEVQAAARDFCNDETGGIDYWRGEPGPAPLGHPDEQVLRRFA